ncbi:hypothetical protein ElyMa_001674100 [Elysia marginata]|uniref:Uncharacterized protein n=1 Tax=Elysia marginata TaxID=1093978 RepID=A0AAV4JT32_9GAST|nr:hypothetical protein ElyMa_001674100 [Elysia marginata]
MELSVALTRITTVIIIALMSILIPTCLAGVTKTPTWRGLGTTTQATAAAATSGTTAKLHSSTRGLPDTGEPAQGDPEIRFGGFFYVSFPLAIANDFFGCMCEETSLECSVQYKLRDNQTSSDFPFLYRVLGYEQVHLPGNDASLYRPHFICDVLNFVPGQDISCRRQLTADQTCETTGKCQSYAANFTLPACSLGCVDLAWLSAFTVPITYTETDHIFTLSENATCSASNNLTSDVTGTEAGTKTDSDGNLQLPMVLGIALGCAGLVVIVAAFGAWRACKRVRTREKSKRNGESMESSLDFPRGSRNKGFGDEREEDEYQEIYDIADGGRVPEHFDEPLEEGYNIIRDEKLKGDFSKSQAENASRPLPVLPDNKDLTYSEPTSTGEASSSVEPSPLPPQYRSGDFQSFSESPPPVSSTPGAFSPSSTTDNGNLPATCTTTDSSSSSTSSTSSTVPLLATSTHPNALLGSRTRKPVTNDESASKAMPTQTLPNPAPHKIPQRENQYDHLGLVNIRSSYQSLSQYSQLKLVRSKQGGIELVTPQDDLPAVEELCSGLQVISLRNGSLCVLGLLEEPPSDDYHKYFKILNMGNDQRPRDEASKGSSLKRKKGGLVQDPQQSAGLPEMQAIYIGSLELENAQTLVSTEYGDYLKLVDIDTAEAFSDDGGYLRVLDIEEANITDTNGDYLTVLDL